MRHIHIGASVMCGLLVISFIIVVVHRSGYDEGHDDGRQQASDDYKSECAPASVKPCFPGPGLMGVQRCQWAGLKNTWGVCEDVHVPR